MSRSTKRAKTVHVSTAAYAASQPLFDALRRSVDRNTDHHAHLTKARDTVQQTHVKLADSIADGDSGSQDRYIDSILEAWTSTTQAFAEIFHALAEATAAAPNEGKPKREGHEEFVKMAAMAAEADRAAASHALHRKQQQLNSQDGALHGTEEEGSKSASEAPSTNSARGSTQSMADPSVSRPRLLKEDKKSAKNRRKMEDARQKYEKKKLALRAKMRRSRPSADTNGATAPAATVEVEYEDVSAEVGARLKAKEAKREAAKKEKKRKRESGESIDVEVVEGQRGMDVKKPARKKSKSDTIGSYEEVKGKRKSGGHGADDVEASGSRRKKARVKS